jgi:hypothetical protein
MSATGHSVSSFSPWSTMNQRQQSAQGKGYSKGKQDADKSFKSFKTTTECLTRAVDWATVQQRAASSDKHVSDKPSTTITNDCIEVHSPSKQSTWTMTNRFQPQLSACHQRYGEVQVHAGAREDTHRRGHRYGYTRQRTEWKCLHIKMRTG